MPENTYALIISIQKYNQPNNFKVLSFLDNDAREMANALETAGVERANITILSEVTATKTAIQQEIIKISKLAKKDDRIIFYFTGHGAYDSNKNWILPVDTYNENIPSTAVSIDFILGSLNRSISEKIILFLDCCHSGFEPGDDTKERNKSFLADQLQGLLRNEQYAIAFASCKSNQTSLTHPKIRHSVWTYFLIQALKGEAGNIYEHGVLISDKLQSFLTQSTRDFVKRNTTDGKEQTPVVFGHQTDRFVIADLNPLFKERKRLKMANAISLTNVTIQFVDDGNIKKLPNFKSGNKLPNAYNHTTDQFVRRSGQPLIDGEIEKLSQQIREEFEYTIDDIEINEDTGSSAIITPDFTYSIDLTLDEKDLSKYIITRRLENFKDNTIALDERFNNIFVDYFDELNFSFSKKINIRQVIRDIEGSGNNNISLNYNHADLSKCDIQIANEASAIRLTAESLSIIARHKTNPKTLVNALKSVRISMLSNPELNLLPL